MNGVVLMAGPKSVLTRFVIHYRLESKEVGNYRMISFSPLQSLAFITDWKVMRVKDEKNLPTTKEMSFKKILICTK